MIFKNKTNFKVMRIDYIRTFKNRFVKSEFNYPTFFDYYFQRTKSQDVLSECRKYDGKLSFVKMYFKLFKHHLIFKKV